MPAHLVESYGKLPLSFEINHGQVDPRVDFISRGNGYTLFLTGNEAVLSLRGQASGVGGQETRQNRRSPAVDRQLVKTRAAGQGSRPADSVLRVRLVAANARAQATGVDELPGKTNYFIGNDPKKWRTNVPTYAKARYRNVYPGIDLVYYGNAAGQLEYDFVVAPGADPKVIELDVWAGVPARGRLQRSLLRLEANGDLAVKTSGGEIRFHRPVVYQEQESRRGTGTAYPSLANRHLLGGHYVLTATNQIQFEIGTYDRSKPLVIDPAIAYSTYLDGTAITDSSSGNSIAEHTDPATGHVYIYVAGQTCASDFPTVNAEQGTYGGGCVDPGSNAGDAFVTKFDTSGSGASSVVYSTYLGGSGSDQGTGIAVDSTANAYVTGYTQSANFPTLNAYQTTIKGVQNAFVAELNQTGSALLYSTYFGGSVNESSMAIALDSVGHA
jgi:hypothetical protein